MNRKLITNMDTDTNNDLCAVIMITLKTSTKPKAEKTYVDGKLSSIHENDKDIDLKEKFNINSKQQSFTDLTKNYDNIVSYNDVKDIFLSRKETFGMETPLDLNVHFIYNVKDSLEADQAVNKKYVDKIRNDCNEMITLFNIGRLSMRSGVNLNMSNNKVIN